MGGGTTPNASATNAFVTVLNNAGNGFVYSTYLGGSGADSASGIAVDSSGIAYVSGLTASTDFPIVNALQPKNAGGSDAFVAKISPNLPGATTSLAVADASGAYGGIVNLYATLTSGGSLLSGMAIAFSLNGTGLAYATQMLPA